jgi:alpha-L-fucosidase
MNKKGKPNPQKVQQWYANYVEEYRENHPEIVVNYNPASGEPKMLMSWNKIQIVFPNASETFFSGSEPLSMEEALEELASKKNAEKHGDKGDDA